MKSPISENGKAVYYAVKSAQTEGRWVTAKDIADATGVPVKSVNGIITMTFKSAKDEGALMRRVEKAVEKEDGTQETKKFIVLTDEGLEFDVEAIPAE